MKNKTTLDKTFDAYLETGEGIEKEFIGILSGLDPWTRKYEQGNYKFSDIIMPNYEKIFEVKRDYKSHETGNFCFEIKFNGAWSGLITTEADYFVMTDKDYFWVFRTAALKNYIKTNLKFFNRTIGGNEDLSEIILVPKKILNGQSLDLLYKISRAGSHLNNFARFIDN